jgi:MerR family transcriptional regulator/heat shock protein HspR
MSERRRSTGGHLEVVARSVHLSPARIRHYIRIGLVRPLESEGEAARFGEAELARLRKIHRLHDDLGLDAAGVEVAIRLLDEIESLRAALEKQRR